jgi:hypothetical protein
MQPLTSFKAATNRLAWHTTQTCVLAEATPIRRASAGSYLSRADEHLHRAQQMQSALEQPGLGLEASPPTNPH